jgi:hypothetical protein
MGTSPTTSTPPGGMPQAVAEWSQPLPDAGGKFVTETVVARRKTLLKIVRKHIANPAEPWARLLPEDLFRALAAHADPQGKSCPDIHLAALADIVGGWARTAADRPRVFHYRQQSEGGGHRQRSTVLHVARCGAYIVVDRGVVLGRDRLVANVLKTCFFSTPHPRDVPAGHAWRTVARRLISKWSAFDGRFGAFRIHPDHARRTVPQEHGVAAVQWEPRFISHEAWGMLELADGTTGFRILPAGEW